MAEPPTHSESRQTQTCPTLSGEKNNSLEFSTLHSEQKQKYLGACIKHIFPVIKLYIMSEDWKTLTFILIKEMF